MKIRIHAGASGTYSGLAPGQVGEVDDAVGEKLVALNLAVKVSDPKSTPKADADAVADVETRPAKSDDVEAATQKPARTPKSKS
jgi:hypothetical protein